jgi:hypothetical protein
METIEEKIHWAAFIFLYTTTITTTLYTTEHCRGSCGNFYLLAFSTWAQNSADISLLSIIDSLGIERV